MQYTKEEIRKRSEELGLDFSDKVVDFLYGLLERQNSNFSVLSGGFDVPIQSRVRVPDLEDQYSLVKLSIENYLHFRNKWNIIPLEDKTNEEFRYYENITHTCTS